MNFLMPICIVCFLDLDAHLLRSFLARVLMISIIYRAKYQPTRVTGSIMDNGASLYPAGRACCWHSKGGCIVTILLNESAQATRRMD